MLNIEIVFELCLLFCYSTWAIQSKLIYIFVNKVRRQFLYSATIRTLRIWDEPDVNLNHNLFVIILVHQINHPILNLCIPGCCVYYKICCMFWSAQNWLSFENQNRQNNAKNKIVFIKKNNLHLFENQHLFLWKKAKIQSFWIEYLKWWTSYFYLKVVDNNL